MANNQKEGRWYKVVEFASKTSKVQIESKMVVIEGSSTDEIVVVRVDNETLINLTSKGGNKAVESFLAALNKTLRGSGYSGGIVLVPPGVEFLKLKKVDKKELEELMESSARANKPPTIH